MSKASSESTGQATGAGSAGGKSAPAAAPSNEELGTRIDALLKEIEQSRDAMEKAIADSPKDEEVLDAVAQMVEQAGAPPVVAGSGETPPAAAPAPPPAEISTSAIDPSTSALALEATNAQTPRHSETDSNLPPEATAPAQIAPPETSSAEPIQDASMAVDTLLAGVGAESTEPRVVAAAGAASALPPAVEASPASAEAPEQDVGAAVDALLAESSTQEAVATPASEPAMAAQPAPPAPASVNEGEPEPDVSKAVDELLAATANPTNSATTEPAPAPSQSAPQSPAPLASPALAPIRPGALTSESDVSKAVDALLSEATTPQTGAVAALSPGGQPGTADVAPPPREAMAEARGVTASTAARDTSHLASSQPDTSHLASAEPAKPPAPGVTIAAPARESAKAPAPAPAPSGPAKVAGMISRSLRRALGLFSAPLEGQSRAVRDSVGWVAAWTVFLAGCLWIYLGFVRQPETHQHAVKNYDFVAGELPEPPEPEEAKPAGGHGEKAEAGGHGAAKEAEGGHGAKKEAEGGHGAKKAEPKKAAKKAEKKPAKKDAHGKAKSEEKKGGGH